MAIKHHGDKTLIVETEIKQETEPIKRTLKSLKFRFFVGLHSLFVVRRSISLEETHPQPDADDFLLGNVCAPHLPFALPPRAQCSPCLMERGFGSSAP